MAEKKSSKLQTILLVILILAIAGFKLWRRAERRSEAEREKLEMIKANDEHQREQAALKRANEMERERSVRDSIQEQQRAELEAKRAESQRILEALESQE